MGFGLSEGGPLPPSGVWAWCQQKSCSPYFRPQHCGPFTAAQVVLDLSDLPTFSPSLSSSRTHLANDEAHALHKGHALSESTSVSLRPKQANCSALKIARVIWTQVTATAPHHLLTGRPQTQTGRGPRPKGQPRLSAHRNEKGGTKNRRLRRYHEMAQSLLVSLLAVQ